MGGTEMSRRKINQPKSKLKTKAREINDPILARIQFNENFPVSFN